MNRGILDEEWTNEPTPMEDKFIKAKLKVIDELGKVNKELSYCYGEMAEGRVDTFMSKTKTLEGKKAGLEFALSWMK